MKKNKPSTPSSAESENPPIGPAQREARRGLAAHEQSHEPNHPHSNHTHQPEHDHNHEPRPHDHHDHHHPAELHAALHLHEAATRTLSTIHESNRATHHLLQELAGESRLAAAAHGESLRALHAAIHELRRAHQEILSRLNQPNGQ